MKKISFFIMTILLFLVMNMVIYSKSQFETTGTNDGLLYITYEGSLANTIKLSIEKSGESDKYNYDVTTNMKFSVPLQLGNGEYTAKLLENVKGNSYRVIAQEKFKVEIKNPNNMFVAASPIVNFNQEMEAIKGYAPILQGEENTKVNSIYERVVNDYSYDNDKAAKVASNYTPNIDEIYKAKKAICYDYSAMMASVLRNQGIPVKLVMGYAPEIEVYHAWNEIFVDNKWIVVDTTYDSAYANAGQKYTMIKEASKFKTLKVY